MLEQSLRIFTRRVGDLLDAERASLFLVDASGSNWCCASRRTCRRAITCASRCERHRRRRRVSGQAVRVDDAYADPRFNRAVDAETGFRTRSVLCLPLHDRDGKVFAVTQLLNRRDGRPFDEPDERRYAEFAASLSVLLESLARIDAGERRVRHDRIARGTGAAAARHRPAPVRRRVEDDLWRRRPPCRCGRCWRRPSRRARPRPRGDPRRPATSRTITRAAAYANFRRALEPYGLPVFCLPGNHDEPALMPALVGRAGFQYGGSAEFGAWGAVFLDTHVHGRPEGHVGAGRTRPPRRRAAADARPARHGLPASSAVAGRQCMARCRGPHECGRGARTSSTLIRPYAWCWAGTCTRSSSRRRGGVLVLATPSTCAQFTPGTEGA